MDNETGLEQADPNLENDPVEVTASDEILKLRADFEKRLLMADLRTEAVRAGMIDLDGLRLVDTSKIQLGSDDRIVDGRRIMTELRRIKPWLFSKASTSSVAVVPVSQPVRQKQAMDMSEEEYIAARIAVTKYQF
jgi:hypothetical protein